MERHEGTPQGGPLSPLLANVLLDEVDQELERRGHAFVRYADDLRCLRRSRRVGRAGDELADRGSSGLNSASQPSQERGGPGDARQFLGFSFWVSQGRTWSRCRIAAKSIAKHEDRGAPADQADVRTSLAQVAKNLRRYLLGWTSVLPARGDAEDPHVIWTSGSVIACERSNSSTGSGAERSIASLTPGVDPRRQPPRSRPTAGAGGRTRRWHSTSRCRTASSTS